MKELLIAIGLEALHRGNNFEAVRVGAPVLPREIWIRGEIVMLLRPAELLKCIAAGVEMRPVQLPAATPDHKLKLVK
jgi:hypothetical protein